MKLIRIVLTPLAWLYSCVLRFRHWLYDIGALNSRQFQTPVICIGNLSLGGTGKTPFTIYIAQKLSQNNKVVIVSRGYKRKTSGLVTLNENSHANDVGDEPLLMFKQLQGVNVTVDSNRTRAIEHLEKQYAPDVILLDDGFQHRKVKARLNILLTDFNNLFSNDQLLPAGRLRDIKPRAKAAQIIVVTKCPENINFDNIAQFIKPSTGQHLFFTRLKHYGLRPIGMNISASIQDLKGADVLLTTGIARPEYLLDFLRQQGANVRHLKFADHHAYTLADIQKVTEIFDTFGAALKMVITTEKDAVKLTGSTLLEQLKKMPVFAIDAQIEFLKEEDLFLKILTQHAR